MRKSSTRTGEITLTVLADNAKLREFSSNTLSGGLALVGQMWVKDYSERKPRDRQRLASKLRTALSEGIFTDPEPSAKTRAQTAPVSAKSAIASRKNGVQPLDLRGRELTELSELELTELIASHPVTNCPHLNSHLKQASRWARLERQAARLRRRVDISEGALVDTFDRVVKVLTSLGYLNAQGEVSESGAVLCRIYSEYDLLLAQCVLKNVFAGLTPAQLAAACSAASYEARREETGAPVPSRLKTVVNQIEHLATDLRQLQTKLKAPEIPESSSALVAATYAWAQGKPLSVALEAAPLEAGDFVRAMKQLLDVLRQLEMVASVETSATARKAQKLILRGVVAWSDL